MKNLILAALAVMAMATGAVAAERGAEQKRPASTPIRGSVWYDVGALKSAEQGPTVNAGSLLGDYNIESGVSHGVGITVGKYFGIGFWFSHDALSNYNKRARPGGANDWTGQTWSVIPRQSDRIHNLGDGPVYATADELRTQYADQYKDLGRQTYGPKFGWDIWGVYPVTNHVSVYAGPGVFFEKSAVFFGITDLSNLADNGQARDDKTSARLAGSAGVQIRPFGQLQDWTGARWMDYVRGIIIVGGYHTERGITFGTGIAF